MWIPAFPYLNKTILLPPLYLQKKIGAQKNGSEHIHSIHTAVLCKAGIIKPRIVM